MPIRYAVEPPNGSSLVRDGLDRLAGRETPLSRLGVDFTTLQVTRPHAVYDLRADAVARGDGLDSAIKSGYRYLIEGGDTPVAAAEVHLDEAGTAAVLANINYGPFVDATARALRNVQTLEPVAAASYETRLLRLAAIALMALWLKSDSGGADIIYPLAPAPPGLTAERAYSADELTQAILPLAQQRVSEKQPGVVP